VTGLRLLVVEDEFIVALELKTIVEAMGHQVCRLVSSGERALEAAAADRPDCVLMDVSISGSIGGVEAAAAIRRDVGAEVVFLTGLPARELEERVRDIQPAAVLAKPIDHGSLRAVLDGLAAGGDDAMASAGLTGDRRGPGDYDVREGSRDEL
jgi:CheY-like chemotaxis protein